MKPMIWEEAGKLCFEQGIALPLPLPLHYWGNRPDWQARCHFLFAEHEKWKSRSDAAMRQFAETRTWPPLPAGSLNYLSVIRLGCAVDTVNILLAGDSQIIPDPLPNVFDSKKVLNWLLIETWHGWRWDTFLKLAVLRSLGGPDSFHGLPTPPQNLN